jgi:peptide/nickel transport system substrate-binding protein
MSSKPEGAEAEDLKARLTKPRAFSRISAFEDLLRRFTPGERFLLYILSITLAASAFTLLAFANVAVSVVVPAEGGALVEGVVGSARFINPLLALSEPDEDLTALVYSGLMRAAPDGSLIPDLASSYTISSDGTVYTFTLRPLATFHNGSPVTAADVLFTVQKAQSPDIKSRRRADWEGVSVSSPDAHTVVFTLAHAYAPFLENTTLGILPSDLWKDVPAEEFPFSPLNTHPVGSGPYRVTGFKTDSTGAATRYELAPFKEFTLGAALIKKITLLFYANEEALISAYNAGRIDSFAGVSPTELEKLTRSDTTIVRAALPRIFGVFFNQNKNPILADASVRAALNAAVDTNAIVENVLGGFASPLTGPIPPGTLGEVHPATPVPLPEKATIATTTTDRAESARAILSRGGWTFDEGAGQWTKKKDVLQFTLATSDDSELSATAQMVAEAWRAAGVKVEVHVYPLSELNTNIIRPRAYEAILFGEVVGRTIDLFAFWHSSQRNDPGLNLALYANARADDVLSEARVTTDPKARETLYNSFASIIEKDQPAVFLYAPEFIYVVPPRMQGIEISTLSTPAERFLNAYQWYTGTERVWNIFINTKNNQS